MHSCMESLCRRRYVRTLFSVLSLFLMTSACGEEEKPKPSRQPVPTTIEWSLNSLELDALEASAELEVVIRDEDGELMEEQEVTWLSLDEEIVEVDERGLVIARANGETEIEARVGEAVGRLPVTVRQQPTSAQVSPDSLHFDALEVEAQLTVDVRDRNGFPVPHAEAVWRSEDEEVATVDTLGIVTSRKAGSTEIRLEIEGSAATDSIVVTVTPEPVELALPSFPETFVAGAPQELQVAIVDGSGHPVAAAQHKVSVGIGENPASGRLFGVRTANAVEGVATFPDLFVDKVGRGYTLVAWVEGLAEVESPVFDVSAGPAAVLRIVDWNGRPAVSGEPLVPVSVQIEDEVGNPVEDEARVRISLAAGPAGAVLSGTLEVEAQDGLATFADLGVDLAGTYQLLVEADGLTPALSPEFSVRAGEVAQLAFLAEPTTVRSQSVIAPAVRVELLDAAGNRVESSRDSVSIALANASGATLFGQTAAQPVGGVATFSRLSVDLAGTYNLVASVAGITETSSPFDVVAGAPARLAFSTQPSDVASGAAMSAVSVEVLDAAGNSVSDATGTVTMSLASNATGATLKGSLAANITGGVATFTGLHMDKVGQGYTLRASAEGLAPAESATFSVRHGTATRLAFLVEPSSVTAGEVVSPVVQVEILDAAGNRVTDAEHSLSLAFGSNPTHATLSGGTATASQGVATFGDLEITKAGTGYTLVAKANGLSEAESRSFDVHADGVSTIAILNPPSTVRAGEVMKPIRLELLDPHGNLVRSASQSIAVRLRSPSGATLGGTQTVVAKNGVAIFDDLSIDKAGQDNVLTFEDLKGLASDRDTPSFTVTASEPARLVFTTQPGDAVAGQVLGQAPVVEVRDAYGNVVEDAEPTVSLSIGQNPGGSELRGNKSLVPTDGVASFGGLALDKVGQGYTLIAKAAGLAATESLPFSVRAGGADHLTFVQEPANVVSRAAMTVRVAVHDAEDNLVTDPVTVKLALGKNPGDATLTAPPSVETVDGVATFTGVSLDKAGQGYTLLATSEGIAERESRTFTVEAGAAKRLAFLTEPSNARSGEALQPAVQVEILDEEGNRVQGAPVDVRIELSQNPGGARLSGAKSALASNGVATFPGLSLDAAADGYQLAAKADGLVEAQSATFDIEAAKPARLAFRTLPSAVTAGEPFEVVIEARDAAGNFAGDAEGVVRLGLGSGPAGAKLSGSATADLVDGVATFALSLDKAATGYSLVAEAAAFSKAESRLFAVEPGAPAALAFDAQPRKVSSDDSFEVRVRILDGEGNFIPDADDEIELRIGKNPVGATLDGAPVPVAAIAGVATFGGLSLDKAGQGTTLIASGSMGSAESLSIDVVAGRPARLAFLAQPQNAAADETLPAVKVEILDAAGNRVRNAPMAVTLGLATLPDGGGRLSGDLQRETMDGVATFADLSIDLAAEDYRLVAIGGGMTVESDPFDIHPGEAARLAFVDLPAVIPTGVPFDVEVEIQDGKGNRVETANDAVSLGVGVGNAGALLGDLLVNASNGRARFEGVWLAAQGDYTLRAYANVLAPGESPSIRVVPRPTSLSVEVQPPATVVAGAPFSVAVQILDEVDAPMAGVEIPVTIRLSDPSAAVLKGNTSVTSIAGLATFGGLTIEEAGGPWVIVAEAPDLVGDSSQPFHVVPAEPAMMVWADLPSRAVVSREVFTPKVILYDAYGNEVDLTPPEAVTLDFDTSSGDPNAILAGDHFATVQGAEAEFSLSIDLVGTYVLLAKYGPLTPLPSDPIVVEAGLPTGLRFVSAPEGSIQLFDDFEVEVAVVDSAGNETEASGEMVKLAFTCVFGTNDFAVTIDPLELEQEVSGSRVNFPGLGFDEVGDQCTLVAQADFALIDAKSDSFDIVPETREFTGHTYVWIPGGTFTPRCATNDPFCSEGSLSCRACTGTEPTETLPDFWMMQYEVTLAEYRSCVDEGPCTAAGKTSPACNWGSDRDDHPINCLTLAQASTYCEWVEARLPTLLEWEYAARSGRDVAFPWGDEYLTPNHANYRNHVAEVGRTTPVGSYLLGRSFWGLMDMSGNVAEWILGGGDAEDWNMGGGFDSLGQYLRPHRDPWDTPKGWFGREVGFRCMMPYAP